MAFLEDPAILRDDRETSKITTKKKPTRLLNRRATAANKDVTKRNAPESPLLRLPPEIRNRIWSYVLGGKTLHIGIKHRNRPWLHRSCTIDDDDDYEYPRCELRAEQHSRYDQRHDHCTKSKAKAKWRRAFLALLKASRQIHLEAALLPYLENTFSFRTCFAFDKFVNSLFQVQRRSLRKVIFSCNEMRACTWPDITSKLCNLTEVTSHQGIPKVFTYAIPRCVISPRLAELPLSKVNIHVTITDHALTTEVEALGTRVRTWEEKLVAESKAKKAARSSDVTAA